MTGLNVAIAGAGIGGLTAAIALQQRGAHVTVYEKATELKELGAGVVIGMNGERVYERLGLKDSLAAIAGKISDWTLQTWQDEPLAKWRAPYPAEHTYPLHRARCSSAEVASVRSRTHPRPGCASTSPTVPTPGPTCWSAPMAFTRWYRA